MTTTVNADKAVLASGKELDSVYYGGAEWVWSLKLTCKALSHQASCFQDRRKNLDAMKYDKKSNALSELKAKRQERERRDQERAQKQKQEKGKGAD